MPERPPPPSEFLEGLLPPPEFLAAASPAIQAVEAAITAHHVIDVNYRRKDGKEVTLRLEPYAFRTDKSGQVKLWAWDVNGNHLDSLFTSDIEAVTDTGEEYPPDDHW